LPELADLKVAVVHGAEIEMVPAERPITIQDLLRHTSGLTYEFRGSGPVHKMYNAARIYSRDQSNADQVAALGKLPLLHQPGTHWEYGRSTDVIGRLIEFLRRSEWSIPRFTCRRICTRVSPKHSPKTPTPALVCS
jgi:CubicO group peptidase (beta-lactamase class C family)